MRSIHSLCGWSAVLVGAFSALCAASDSSPTARPLDPAGWGGDHVGKPVPEYVTGDECLFCHRSDVGPSWSQNRHQRTIREAEAGAPAVAALQKSPALKPLAADVKLLMGGPRSTRFLRKSSAYGKLDLLTAAWDTPPPGKEGRLRMTGDTHWDTTTFAQGCAGCHATAVDPQTRAFAAVALDCYTCHGDVSATHAKDGRQVYLSKKHKDPARVVTSICAQCHVRTGKSKSSGLPYPDNFVAGDNLFRDFQVDLSAKAIRELNPIDRHVLENVRDVAVLGKEERTCLSCHNVHKQSSRKHVYLEEDESCLTCHTPSGSRKIRQPFEVHSRTCQY
jgi:hypothetical protein